MKLTKGMEIVLGFILLITTILGCQKELLEDKHIDETTISAIDSTKKTLEITPKDTSLTPAVITPKDTTKAPVVAAPKDTTKAPIVAAPKDTAKTVVNTVPQTITVDYLKQLEYKAGSNDYFILKSNTTWKITSAPTWALVSPLSGTGDAKVTVTVQGNTGAQRTGTITITATGVAKPVSLAVVQLAAPAPPPAVATVQIANANYFVAPTGSDNNPGTFEKPFASLQKAYSVMSPGQLTYIMGGNYTTNTNIILSGRSGTDGNYIKLWAYPGQTPVLSPAAGFANDWGINLKADYIHLKGLEITGFKQDANKHLAPGIYSLGASNCIFELLNLHHNGMGAYIKGNNNQYINCDFHHNQDPYSGYSNGDGLEAYALTPNTTTGTTTIKGCRAWANADDGFDVSDCDASVVFENCWSWGNGFQTDGKSYAGDGNGFKLGWTNGSYPTTVKRKLTNCMAWGNTGNGFDQNNADCAVIMYHNTSYNNGKNTGGSYGQYKYGYQFQYKNTHNVFKNNISYKNLYGPTMILSNSTQGNNSWNNGIAISDADFVSLDPTGADAKRKTDGSIPDINFLKVKTTSRLATSGTNVGISSTLCIGAIR